MWNEHKDSLGDGSKKIVVRLGLVEMNHRDSRKEMGGRQ